MPWDQAVIFAVRSLRRLLTHCHTFPLIEAGLLLTNQEMHASGNSTHQHALMQYEIRHCCKHTVDLLQASRFPNVVTQNLFPLFCRQCLCSESLYCDSWAPGSSKNYFNLGVCPHRVFRFHRRGRSEFFYLEVWHHNHWRTLFRAQGSARWFVWRWNASNGLDGETLFLRKLAPRESITSATGYQL